MYFQVRKYAIFFLMLIVSFGRYANAQTLPPLDLHCERLIAGGVWGTEDETKQTEISEQFSTWLKTANIDTLKTQQKGGINVVIPSEIPPVGANVDFTKEELHQLQTESKKFGHIEIKHYHTLFKRYVDQNLLDAVTRCIHEQAEIDNHLIDKDKNE